MGIEEKMEAAVKKWEFQVIGHDIWKFNRITGEAWYVSNSSIMPNKPVQWVKVIQTESEA